MKKALCYVNNIIFMVLSSFIVVCLLFSKLSFVRPLMSVSAVFLVFGIFVIILEFIKKDRILCDKSYNYMILMFIILSIIESFVFTRVARFLIISISATPMIVLYFAILVYNFLKTENFKELFIIKKNKQFKNFLCLLALFVLSIFILIASIRISPFYSMFNTFDAF